MSKLWIDRLWKAMGDFEIRTGRSPEVLLVGWLDLDAIKEGADPRLMRKSKVVHAFFAGVPIRLGLWKAGVEAR